MNIQPPKCDLQFLRWFCREDFLDEIEGDLIEVFELRFQENLKKANRSFWWQVIKHFSPSLFETNPLVKNIMLNRGMQWHKWLNSFAYQVGMDFFVFATSGVTTLVIALATISWQSLKAAVTNPVNSLRSEE